MGAAGRDFHNFNTLYRNDASREVVAFTAAQIPFIEKRTYPPALSGQLYPEGIPIYPEAELERLVKEYGVREVVFSYSDVSYDYVMHWAALCNALGADFILPSAENSMLESSRPVISICAVRTGCGKSGISRYIGKLLLEMGREPVVIRHPMPYGDLASQSVQRFACLDDLARHQCTIEEMEEYEPHLAAGLVVYSGVDYEAILKEAEKEGRLIIWDGGNNDLPFIRPDLEIVVADPLRPGDELLYYPGETNLRRADVAVINKANNAIDASIHTVMDNIRKVNLDAAIVKTASAVTTEKDINGKRVLVIEDGPTLTHGGMSFGAGIIAARNFKAVPVDPRPYAVGTIKEVFAKYPHLGALLPAMGYSDTQKKELEETINKTPFDMVLIATPIDLTRVLKIDKPSSRVSYEIEEMESPGLKSIVEGFVMGLK
ncbi:MAG: GTPase [Deltaproteobacteria bacterium]|nr:GTPase [Deltaproteobacteria bacterium]